MLQVKRPQSIPLSEKKLYARKKKLPQTKINNRQHKTQAQIIIEWIMIRANL